MSWSKFNESLNSLKGQVSTFIDTIVPEEDPEEVAERPDDAELSGLVAAQENEIALLRRQVAELRQQQGNHSRPGHHHEGGSGNAPPALSGQPVPQSVAAVAASGTSQPQQQLLEEDSWFWEPEKTSSSASSTKTTGDPIISKSGSGSDLTLIPLDQPCSGATTTTSSAGRRNVESGEIVDDQRRRLVEQEQQVKKLTLENAVLSEKNKQLQAEAREANENIEELDKQHNLIMETILGQKNGLQAKCTELTDERSQLSVKFKQMEQDFIASQEDYLLVQREYADYKQRFNEENMKDYVAKEEIEEVLRDVDFTFASENPLADLKVLLESRQQTTSDDSGVIAELEKKLSDANAKWQQANEERKKIAHEKDTLQADLINYEIECAELLKNNEKLLEELEQTKCGKLETIPEHSEESFTVLEKQLEDTVTMNRNLEDDYNDLNLKYASLTEDRARLDEELRETVSQLRAANETVQQLEEERAHLVFQVNELQSTTATEADDSEQERRHHDQELEELRSQLLQRAGELGKSKQAIEESNKRAEQAAEQLSNTLSELTASQAAVQVHEQLNNALIAEKQQLHDENGNYATAVQQLTEERRGLQRSLAALKAESDAKVAALEDQLRSVDREIQQQRQPSDDEVAAAGAAAALVEELRAAAESHLAEIARLSEALVQLGQEKNDLIGLVTTKHQESLQYHGEVQRVGLLLQQEMAKKKDCERCPELLEKVEQLSQKVQRMDELERQTDQVHFLKEKSDILTSNLLVEQNLKKMLQREKEEVVAERVALEKDLERLRQHLMAIEEEHTGQMMELQRQMEDYKARATAMEHEAKYANTAYTSASIRANQQNETLQAQYKLLEQQRDEMALKLSQAEDRDSKNEAALVNLECALEQFQREKQRDIENALYLVRKEVAEEKQRYANLMSELQGTHVQLNEAKAGLMAAARISDQLESSQRLIADQKEELRKLVEKSEKMEQQRKRSEETDSDKVEKGLIKNLVIGYMTAPNNGKGQILKLLSAVLEFSPAESERVGVNKSQSGWLGGLLHSNAGENSGNEGIAQAFVQFLEQESRPVGPDSGSALLTMMGGGNSSLSAGAAAGPAGHHSFTTNHPENVSVSPSPSSIQQPTMMADATMQHTFAPSRNSSSILKDVLNDDT